MSELRELYQQVIIDHGRHPRNFSVLANATVTKEGFNPLCGDQLTVYLSEIDGVVEAASFQGCGCAISMASASLMTETIKGKSLAQIEKLFADFHHLVTHDRDDEKAAVLGKLAVLAGVAEFPARVKCATLAWHTLLAALKHDQAPVTTEK
jgi:nitrogen fixation NifU-like protein